MRKEFDVEAFKLALEEAGCAATINLFVIGIISGPRYLHCHVYCLGAHVRCHIYISIFYLKQFYH